MLYALVNEGLTLYRAGRFFDAHEIWEHAWVEEVGRTKLTLQALIQIAAGLHKHAEGNPRGPSKLLAKAKDKIADIREGCAAWLGIDMVRLAAEVDRALAEADAFHRGERETITPPWLPACTGRDGIVYLHGFASGPSSFKASVLVPPLRGRGLSVAVPDLNDGGFEGLTLSRAIGQTKRLLRERTLLIGSSFGGYVASRVAAQDDRVKGLVLMAPAFDLAARMKARYGAEAIAAWQAHGRTQVEHYAYGEQRDIAYGFFEDAQHHPPFVRVSVPTYVLQGANDEVVTPDLAERFRSDNEAHVELDLVEDDHGLTGSAERALSATERMIERLGLEAQPADATLEAAERRLVQIDEDPSLQ